MRLLLFILMLPIACFGQTRMYLSATNGGTGISPSFDGGWEVTTTSQRRKCNDVKDGTTLAARATDAHGAAAVRDVLNVQFVSTKTLAAQTITGNITAQIKSSASGTTSRAAKATISIRVISPAGTVRGTLYSSLGTGYGTDLGIGPPNINRSLTSTALSSVVVTAGDYLIIEIGETYTTGTNTTGNYSNDFGSSSATDLAVDNSSTAANNAWIEFSNTITWFTASTNKGIPISFF